MNEQSAEFSLLPTIIMLGAGVSFYAISQIYICYLKAKANAELNQDILELSKRIDQSMQRRGVISPGIFERTSNDLDNTFSKVDNDATSTGTFGMRH